MTKTNDLLGGIKGLLNDINKSANADINSSSKEDAIRQWGLDAESLGNRYDDVRIQLGTLKTLISGDFTNNIVPATVISCPYNKNLVGMGMTIPISIDICSILAPIYSTLYFIFYLIFFVGFLSSTFYVIVNTSAKG